MLAVVRWPSPGTRFKTELELLYPFAGTTSCCHGAYQLSIPATTARSIRILFRLPKRFTARAPSLTGNIIRSSTGKKPGSLSEQGDTIELRWPEAGGANKAQLHLDTKSFWLPFGSFLA